MQTNLVEGGKYVTTIQISQGLRYAIKSKGMSLSGALLQGWIAIEERKNWNEQMRAMRETMEKYRAEAIRLRKVQTPVGTVERER